MLTVVAVLFILAAIAPWSTDIGADLNYLKLIGQGLWSGIVRISTAPLADWRAALGRFVFAVGAVLFLASLWSPLPAATSNGTYEDLHRAVIEYQRAHGLNPDGVWGPKTNTLYVKGK